MDYELVERFQKVLENFNDEHKTDISLSAVCACLVSIDEDENIVKKELTHYLNQHLPEITLLDSELAIGDVGGQKFYLYKVI